VIDIGTIGAKALYLLFAWLISAAIAAWMSERKGYGERAGLTFGLILSVVGLLIVLLMPARPNSKWKVQGWRPQRRRRAPVPGAAPSHDRGSLPPVSGG
jgi:hypothetical protein